MTSGKQQFMEEHVICETELRSCNHEDTFPVIRYQQGYSDTSLTCSVASAFYYLRTTNLADAVYQFGLGNKLQVHW
jgi:hypothetical protein